MSESGGRRRWEHRVLFKPASRGGRTNRTPYFTMMEAYCLEGEELPSSYIDEMVVLGHSLDELRDVLGRMVEALDKPVLVLDGDLFRELRPGEGE